MVNAANTGGVTGFGLDEMVNRAAGDFEIKRARRAFGGIATGDAKFTRSYNHSKVKFIIHAVGPVYRANATGRGCSTEDKDRLLASAYRSALARAGELGAATVGFCLLSAGVFRGDRRWPTSRSSPCAPSRPRRGRPWRRCPSSPTRRTRRPRCRPRWRCWAAAAAGRRVPARRRRECRGRPPPPETWPGGGRRDQPAE